MNRPGISWITFKPSDIATAKQFIDLLKGESTVDALGLTRAMEGVSDILFPATSTLHKRIRYQVFVPSIILAIHRSKHRVKPEYELAQLEYQLQRTLIDSGETHSVFGSSRGEALKYWPSTIYWASLNKLQIWGREPLGRGEALEIIEEHKRSKYKNDEEDADSTVRELEPIEDLDGLYASIFPKNRMAKFLRFDLEPAEAKFFRSRFLELFPNSITTYILKHGSRRHLASGFENLNCPKNPKLDHLLSQARAFSGIAMGAYYAYRWALCRERREAGRLSRQEERANSQHFDRWLGRNLRNVDLWQYSDLTQALFALGGSTPDRKEGQFVENFLRGASRAGGLGRRLSALDQVVREREEDVKGRNYSHFTNPNLQVPKNTLGADNYRDYYFDYRWAQGKENLRDIFDGLNRQ